MAIHRHHLSWCLLATLLMTLLTARTVHGKGTCRSYDVRSMDLNRARGSMDLVKADVINSLKNKYPNCLDFTWHIEINGPKVIEIELKLVLTEANYDYVQVCIPDGRCSEKYSGRHKKVLIADLQSKELDVRFVSDKRTTKKRGLVFRWYPVVPTSGCDSWMNSELQQIKTPSGKYEDEQTCEFSIPAPEGQLIRLTFDAMEVEPAAVCEYDYVLLQEVKANQVFSLTTLCGTQLPLSTISSASTMKVIFTSDEVASYSGISASWEVITTREADTHFCDTLNEVVLDEGTPSREIRPSEAGYHYRNNMDCTWRITALPRKKILVTFSEFRLQDSANCDKDYVAIYSTSNTGGRPLVKHCGFGACPTPLSNFNELTIVFHSDEAMISDGFVAHVEMVDGPPEPPQIPPDVCGRRLPSDPRVVGGHQSSGVTWTVSLQQRGTDFHFCGGSIIAEKKVLTAAHCVEDLSSPNQIELVIGTQNLKCGNGMKVQVSGIAIHPDYNTYTADNDFAVLTTVSSLLNENTSKVCLPTAQPEPSTSCIVTGWGDTLFAQSGAVGALQEADITLSSNQECANLYAASDYASDAEITPNMVCGSVTDLADSCQGDSGGPVACEIGGSYVQHGVVSFGYGCGLPDHPGVYARVYAALEWVEEQLQPSVCDSWINFELGEIRTPSAKYQDDLECEWVVSGAGDEVILLRFDLMEVEPASVCSYDNVYLQEGTDDDLLVLCGTRLPPNTISNSNAMKITFYSDEVVSYRGIGLSWEVISRDDAETYFCDASTEIVLDDSNPTKEIRPSAPGFHYRTNMECVWHITAPEGKRIFVTFSEFRVEISTNCKYDHLAIYEGDETTVGNLLIKHCGVGACPTPVSTSNKITFKFISDDSVIGEGFVAHVEMVDEAPEPPEFPDSLCGVPELEQNYKVVGGFQAVNTAHQVSLQFSGSDFHFCGGSIIDEFHVLTAAHCVEDLDSASEIKLVIGTSNLKCGNGIEVLVSAFYIHPDYNTNTLDNDFAVLKTSSSLLTGSTSKVCLPTSQPDPDTPCFVTGWGDTLFAGSSDVGALQQANITLSSNEDCNTLYQESDFANYPITENMVCGTVTDMADSCQGDSGGPVVCKIDGSYVQHGVVSFGFGCGLPDHPGVYSRVYAAIDWIKGSLVPQASLCDAWFNASLREIRTPDSKYRDYFNCEWTITGEIGKVIRLDFDFMEVEPTAVCGSDNVKLKEATSSDVFNLRTLCGTRTPPSTISSTDQMRVMFTSDSDFSYAGFSLSWEVLTEAEASENFCSPSTNVVLSDSNPSEEIRSSVPRFHYRTNMECVWHITAPPGKLILVTFSEFRLEKSRNCRRDYVAIYDGAIASGAPMKKHCGFGACPTPVSSSNELTIKFNSNNKVTNDGFVANVEMVDGPPLPPQGAVGECGSREFVNVAPSRVVGGVQTAAPIPWQISMQYAGSGFHFCGGSIIGDKVVLTAAHCVTHLGGPDEIEIVIGTPNLRCGDGTKVQVSTITPHPNYNDNTLDNDFAIIETSTSLLNGNTGKVCLPTAQPEPDTRCIVTGWGDTLFAGSSDLNSLQEANITLSSNEDCGTYYSESEYVNWPITENMVCGTVTDMADSCQGDSGGPVTCEIDGDYVQHGVVSFGLGCGLPDHPGVYSRVYTALDWINGFLNED